MDFRPPKRSDAWAPLFSSIAPTLLVTYPLAFNQTSPKLETPTDAHLISPDSLPNASGSEHYDLEELKFLQVTRIRLPLNLGKEENKEAPWDREDRMAMELAASKKGKGSKPTKQGNPTQDEIARRRFQWTLNRRRQHGKSRLVPNGIYQLIAMVCSSFSFPSFEAFSSAYRVN